MTDGNVIPFPNQKTVLQIVQENRAKRIAEEEILIAEIEELKRKLGETKEKIHWLD
ncbi:hypothetical protein [Bacillus sp. FJAT-28004]|uniref:hypothetical protein n=1 Tax=Bacillus sp. FJAT-28004 TaxID=1679165 RepID=UPI000A858BDC|nr:hypothetical protein [Bacillus sp. FJAT-28004]